MTRPLTTAEAAGLLNCSSDSVIELIRQGKLRAWRLGRQWRIEAEELARFKQAQSYRVPVRALPSPRGRVSRLSGVEDWPEAKHFT